MSEIMSTAVSVEKAIHNLFSTQYSGMPEEFQYEIPSSELYGVKMSEDNAELVLVDKEQDVYDILMTPARKRNASFTTWAIVTTGWAAPLGDNGEPEGAPSEHPLRRRVRLVITADADGVASVLRFADDPSTPITDPGSATGTLADAVRFFVTR